MTAPTALTALDDRATVDRLDPHGLLGRIEALPEQCEEAWRCAGEFELPSAYRDAREVVLLGMGGSAIAGDIVRSIASTSGRKPIYVVRGYDAPGFVSEQTLVVACSHSGNTEETLSSVRQSLDAGARGIAVTTGGELRSLAGERGIHCLSYDYDGEPRSAIGHQLMTLLSLAERAGLLASQGDAVAEAVSLMREQRARIGHSTSSDRNAAKQLAGRLRGKLPVIVGGGVLSDAAYRWKTQINENAKSWAFHETMPELNHNAIAGFGLPEELVPRLHVVFLHHSALHPRLRLHYDAAADALTAAGVAHERVEALGSSGLAQALTSLHFGDLVSYYLALLNRVEPAPVQALDKVKAKLAQS
ncbi:MAG: bifunctional phosphoglucose/phosphomannose isomerase [Dehalococcoidia bacterium]